MSVLWLLRLIFAPQEPPCLCWPCWPAGAYVGAWRRPLAPAGGEAAAPSTHATPVVAAAQPADDDEPPIDPTHCPPQPLDFTEVRRAGPRRYMGTIAGEPVTAELTLALPDSISGRFYLWRSGQEYELA